MKSRKAVKRERRSQVTIDRGGIHPIATEEQKMYITLERFGALLHGHSMYIRISRRRLDRANRRTTAFVTPHAFQWRWAVSPYKRRYAYTFYIVVLCIRHGDLLILSPVDRCGRRSAALCVAAVQASDDRCTAQSVRAAALEDVRHTSVRCDSDVANMIVRDHGGSLSGIHH